MSSNKLHQPTLLASAALAESGDITEAGLEMEEIPLQLLRNVPSQQQQQQPQPTTAPTSSSLFPS